MYPEAIRGKGVSTATVNRYMALVRTILRRACDEWEWLDRVPKVGMFRDQEGRIRSLSRDEYTRLIAELPKQKWPRKFERRYKWKLRA